MDGSMKWLKCSVLCSTAQHARRRGGERVGTMEKDRETREGGDGARGHHHRVVAVQRVIGLTSVRGHDGSSVSNGEFNGRDRH